MINTLKSTLGILKTWAFQSSPQVQFRAGQKKFRHESRSCKFREQLNGILGGKHPFEIRSSTSKGLGVFARMPIPRTSIIMRDPIVLSWKRGEEPQQIYHRLLRHQTNIQEEIFKLARRWNKEQIFVAGLQLRMGGVKEDVFPKILLLFNILATNSFRIDDDDPQKLSGLCLNASRINHSCLPNANYFYGVDSGLQSFIANRNIAKGEEITISYINPLRHRAARQLDLNKWGFVCQCPACDVDHPDSRTHEDRLRSIVRLNQDPCMEDSKLLEAIMRLSRNALENAAKRARQRIELLSKHNSTHTFLRQAYMVAFYIAIAQHQKEKLPSKLTEAIKSLETVIALETTFLGGDSASVDILRDLCHRLKQGHILRDSLYQM